MADASKAPRKWYKRTNESYCAAVGCANNYRDNSGMHFVSIVRHAR